jgi:hypothetical protein
MAGKESSGKYSARVHVCLQEKQNFELPFSSCVYVHGKLEIENVF